MAGFNGNTRHLIEPEQISTFSKPIGLRNIDYTGFRPGPERRNGHENNWGNILFSNLLIGLLQTRCKPFLFKNMVLETPSWDRRRFTRAVLRNSKSDSPHRGRASGSSTAAKLNASLHSTNGFSSCFGRLESHSGGGVLGT